MSQEEKFEIDGAIQIANSDDPTPDAGTIRWTGSDFEGWDGSQWVSFSSITSLTDLDNNIYKVVQIGTQTWMAENLKTTKYANGNDIPDGTGLGDLSLVNNPKFWFAYNDDLDNIPIYGRMYTWYAVADIQNICPAGWHVPTEAELTTLINFLGTSDMAGGKMKLRELPAGTVLIPERIIRVDFQDSQGAFVQYLDFPVQLIFWASSGHQRHWILTMVSTLDFQIQMIILI